VLFRSCNYIKFMTGDIEFEWDQIKFQKNLQKHGVDFGVIIGFEWDAAIYLVQSVGNEERVLAYAPIDHRLYALVYTIRGPKVRVISLRKANAREVANYEAQTD